MSFPNKDERAKCWSARDKLWDCLDKHNIEKSEAIEANSPCVQFRKLYEESCSAQWVKHFDRKRSYLKYKEKIETRGFEPLDEDRDSVK